MEKLYAEYHKMEFRPPKDFITTDESLQQIAKYIGFDYGKDFENKSLSKFGQYQTVTTYRRLIDFEFLNSLRYGRTLNRIEKLLKCSAEKRQLQSSAGFGIATSHITINRRT